MRFYKNKKINFKKGQVMLLTAIFFMTFALTISMGFINPIIEQAKISNNYWSNKDAYFLTESGIEDAVYRFKNKNTIDISDNFLINGELIHISISEESTSTLISKNSNIKYQKNMVANVQMGDENTPFQIIDWKDI